MRTYFTKIWAEREDQAQRLLLGTANIKLEHRRHPQLVPQIYADTDKIRQRYIPFRRRTRLLFPLSLTSGKLVTAELRASSLSSWKMPCSIDAIFDPMPLAVTPSEPEIATI
jgi:hypothetical protein